MTCGEILNIYLFLPRKFELERFRQMVVVSNMAGGSVS